MVEHGTLSGHNTGGCRCDECRSVAAEYGRLYRKRKGLAYSSFKKAKARCLNPHNLGFSNYGGRGIEFRFDSYAQFLEELGPRPVGTSLDRIDNDGHYEAGNVRWAIASTQATNRRKPRKRRKPQMSRCF